ncbi:DUF6033 family protein [Butyrivibrio sp. INlla14]|uniref:DUF6033 family protein n=1 Tax=Butyrivibrio sp. INlla14 TaxID=1520808 RepID=UPI0008769C81|nr:DUF6033 family protein [Butyrivibrio sp. INlla14]SCY11306.1 hypothetical protein SAMN02910371_01111 [Butyrivibrio sp. INlla14]
MNNAINVNGMTRYQNSFIQSMTAKKTSRAETSVAQNTGSEDKDSFISTVRSKVDVSESVEMQGAKEVTAISTKDMSLEEYKNYIHDQISSFPWCADKMGDNYSIHISDDGFKAMQNDPEYEKWVLGTMKEAFATPLPGWVRSMGGKDFVVAHYGATKEECSCTGWSVGYQGGTGDKVWEAQSKGSFWSKRGEASKAQARQDRKLAEKKALEKKWQQEAIEKRQAYTDFLNGKAMLKTDSLEEFNNIFATPVDAKVAGIMSAYEAGTIGGGGLF